MSEVFQSFKPRPDKENLVDISRDPAEPPLLHRSYSQVSSFLTCGLRYRLERRENLRHPPTWSLVGGKAFHLFSERLDDGLSDAGDWPLFFANYVRTEEEQSAIKSSKWAAANKGKEDGVWWSEAGEGMAERWLAYRAQWAVPGNTVKAEIGVEFTAGNVRVVGYIDRLISFDGTSRTVVDIKTGKMKTVNKLQYAMYEYGIRQLNPDVEFVFHEQWHARSGEATPVKITKRDLAYVEWIVQKMDYADRLDLHLPGPGPLCSVCSVKAHCPAV